MFSVIPMTLLVGLFMIPMLASSPWIPRGQQREPVFWAASLRKCALWVATSSPTDSRWSQYFLTMVSWRFNPHSTIKYSKILCGSWIGILIVSAVSSGIRTTTSTVEGSWIFKRFMLLILVHQSKHDFKNMVETKIFELHMHQSSRGKSVHR